MTLLESHEIAVVDVAMFADGDVEIVRLVTQIRFVLPDVVGDTAGPEHRPRERIVDGLGSREGADVLRAAHPYGVASQHAIDLAQSLRECLREFAQLLVEAIG